MVETVKYYSKALNKEKVFSVMVPERYDRNEEYDFVMVLHGMGRHHKTVIECEELREKLQASERIYVFPDGEMGCYIDSMMVEHSNYQSMLFEILTLVEEKYNITKNINKRTIIGWSMGAFGAANMIIKQPSLFKNFISIIGLLDYPNTGYKEEWNYVVQPVFDNDYEKYSAARHMDKFYDKNVLIYAGTTAFDYQMNLCFYKKAVEENINCKLIEETGGHAWNTVYNGFLAGLLFLEEVEYDKQREAVDSTEFRKT